MYEWKTISIWKDVLNQMLNYRPNARTLKPNAKDELDARSHDKI